MRTSKSLFIQCENVLFDLALNHLYKKKCNSKPSTVV